MTAIDLPVLIIHTGDPEDPIRARHDSYAGFVRRAAGLAPEDVHIVPVFQGEPLPDPARYRAAFITGSPAMVTDREPWSEQTAQWLRHAAAQGLPMFGICYGHQLLAHALGGLVAYNPAGREVGTHMVQHLAEDPLLVDLPRPFPAQMMHLQSVIQPPPGAIVLASSALDAHQMLRMGPNIVSTQFHPEFPPEFVLDNLERNTAKYGREDMDVEALKQDVRPTPEAAGLLRRFLALHAPVPA
ncbi:glutamine amidotransferase [Bordetella bronchialis]|uniref:GMP synthase n=1 Tax=Bordetella bronchialis TaxID=463025 RepID=A0A193FPL4_9BORD|nr:glutamine amidotransferase [Bordetella bronchialis]ANN69600.1 GMP synthase [Bordetella bronchialis]ANN74747.1 GMP synthase [Bordetella bronchialis]